MTASGVLCLILFASFFHLSFKNMYMYMYVHYLTETRRVWCGGESGHMMGGGRGLAQGGRRREVEHVDFHHQYDN